MATGGRRPKPVEVKRLTGNPGKRPLPNQATVTLLPGAPTPPAPSRPLQETGLAMWNRIWTSGATWLAAKVDAESVLVLCERMDERQALRDLVMAEGDWRQRGALRVLEAQIDQALGNLAFTPTERSRMGVAEVKPASRIEELLAKRNGTGA